MRLATRLFFSLKNKNLANVKQWNVEVWNWTIFCLCRPDFLRFGWQCSALICILRHASFSVLKRKTLQLWKCWMPGKWNVEMPIFRK